MKLKISFEKGIEFSVERTPDEYRLMEQDQLFQQQIKIAKIPSPKGTGDTFQNCTINNREPVIIPTPMMMQMQMPPQKSAVAINQEFIDKAIDYTTIHTGVGTDIAQKVVDAMLQYFKDRGVL